MAGAPAETEFAVSIFHGQISHLSCDPDSISVRPFAGLEVAADSSASRTGLDVVERGGATRNASGTEAASAQRRQPAQQPGLKALS